MTAEGARVLTNAQQRGLTLYSPMQRTIVVEFDSPEEAEFWDALDDDQAFAVLYAAALARKAAERDAC
jgi:hypothetical protein